MSKISCCCAQKEISYKRKVETSALAELRFARVSKDLEILYVSSAANKAGREAIR